MREGRIQVNMRNAEGVLLKLVENWRKNPQELPQHKTPRNIKTGSLEHKIYLFVFTFLTPRTDAELLAKELTQIFEQNPELYFDVDQLLTKIAKSKIPTMNKQRTYIKQAFEHIGEPQNIDELIKYPTVNSFLRYKSERGIYTGFGPKLYSLYRMTLEETGVATAPDDAFPIDAHIVRMLTNFGAVQIAPRGSRKTCIKTMERAVRPEICSFLKKHGLRAYELHNPMWHLSTNKCSSCTPLFGCELKKYCTQEGSVGYWSGMLT